MAMTVEEILGKKAYKQRFKDDANEHFLYPSGKELLDNLNDLQEMVEEHRTVQRPRLEELRDYYKGNNRAILKDKRRKEEHLADHRATHNFAKYVSQFIQCYMVVVPIKTVYNEDAVDDFILDMNRTNDADEHNSELVLDQSIYGRAYELLYRNKDDETRFT